jgi:hypothetical protein
MASIGQKVIHFFIITNKFKVKYNNFDFNNNNKRRYKMTLLHNQVLFKIDSIVDFFMSLFSFRQKKKKKRCLKFKFLLSYNCNLVIIFCFQ